MTDRVDINAANEDGVIVWVRGLAADAVVRWGDDGESPAPDVHYSHVDVFLVDVDLGLNWVWTIIGPDHDDDDESSDPMTIVAEFDVDIWQVREPDRWYLDQPTVITRRGEQPSGPQRENLDAAVDGDRTLDCRGGWTTSAIHATLAEWMVARAGRTDIEFVYVAEAVSAFARRIFAEEVDDPTEDELVSWDQVKAEFEL